MQGLSTEDKILHDISEIQGLLRVVDSATRMRGYREVDSEAWHNLTLEILREVCIARAGLGRVLDYAVQTYEETDDPLQPPLWVNSTNGRR